MDPGVLDVAVTHSSKLLAKVCAVLVLNVLNDRIPASDGNAILIARNCVECEENSPVLVVDLVAIARCVDDVQTQADTIFGDDYTQFPYQYSE